MAVLDTAIHVSGLSQVLALTQCRYFLRRNVDPRVKHEDDDRGVRQGIPKSFDL